jgi:hypothetical protein
MPMKLGSAAMFAYEILRDPIDSLRQFLILP